jgi:hypothetical protein
MAPKGCVVLGILGRRHFGCRNNVLTGGQYSDYNMSKTITGPFGNHSGGSGILYPFQTYHEVLESRPKNSWPKPTRFEAK